MSASPLNLALDAWLPVHRADGSVDRIAAWQVTDIDPVHGPIMSFAWPRADFDGAAHEFLIGLLVTTAAPADDDSWLDWWDQPPAPAILKDKFAASAHAFVLNGDGPRFMQDLDPLDDAEPAEMGGLLIDMPGENTIKKNADLFAKRGQVAILSRAAAAMALYTLQTYAPSGGQGHRTSLRGGGPLTTLAIARHPTRKPSLWDRLWPSVETRKSIDKRRPSDVPAKLPVFPWLTPTRTSDPKARGGPTSPRDADPLQVYWGMPRRIRLEFEPANGRICDLTGLSDAVMVTAYRSRNYGVQYTEGFAHPLSPYYAPKKGAARLPVHPQPGGISYRHWLGLVVADREDRSIPAASIQSAKRHARELECFASVRIAAFGYDMDNMKARGWVLSEMPILRDGAGFDEKFATELVNALIPAAETAMRATTLQIKAAWVDRPAEATGDYGFIGERFWRDTEAAFYETMHEAQRLYNPDLSSAEEPAMRRWLAVLRRHALALFDEYASADDLRNRDMARLVRARWSLLTVFTGSGKLGGDLYNALGLPIVKKPKSQAGNKGAKP
jgi:CRISPR system Cascade subunit CasA